MNNKRLAEILNAIVEKSDDYGLYHTDEVKSELADACNELDKFVSANNLSDNDLINMSIDDLRQIGVNVDDMLMYIDFNNLYDIYEAVFFRDSDYIGGIKQMYFEESLELPDRDPSPNTMSVVDIIKTAYDSGKFDDLRCVGRDKACTLDIYGPDKDRLIGFFDRKPEFNREDHFESGIHSAEFISDKYDVEIFDTFIRIYKIPQNENVKELKEDIELKQKDVLKFLNKLPDDRLGRMFYQYNTHDRDYLSYVISDEDAKKI